MVPIQQILDWAERLKGLPYVFGTEQDGKDRPTAEDCSELVQNACDMNGVVPEMPDGAIYQMRHCRANGALITIDEAMKTPGALLFRISQDLGNHVVFSLGNGMTFEARGRAYGVGSWPATGRVWTHACLIPGVKYSDEEKHNG